MAVVTLVATSSNYRTEPNNQPLLAIPPTAKARVVQVTGEDFKFEAPDVIPAGLTEFRFLNKGPALHHMALLKLIGGKTVDDLVSALAKPGPLPSWAKELGGPNAAAPGEEANATLTLEPGNYAFICFVDIGGPPHFAKGMVKPLRVVPSTSRRGPNPSRRHCHSFDYNFKLRSRCCRQAHIRVHNTGRRSMRLQLVQLAPGATSANS